MKKKILALIALVLALAIVPCAALAAGDGSAEVIASGSCGTDASWTIDADGVLKITGTGAITCVPIPSGLDPDIDKARDYLEIFDRRAVVWGPWCEDYRDQITEIRVGCGITKISAGAFMDLQNVQTVYIGENVAEIGHFAFGYCKALKDIYLPGTLEELGILAFGGCDSIEHAYFPEWGHWEHVYQEPAGRIITAEVQKRHPEYVSQLTNDNMTAHITYDARTHGHMLVGEFFHSDKLHWGECVICGETVYSVHKWDSGEVIQAPSVEHEGIKHFTCTVCGEEKTEAMNRASYAGRAYEVILERIGDEDGIHHWDEEMEHGLSAGMIISEFLRSDEFTAKGKSNEEIVKIVYNAMLGRDPDEEGLANWTALLDAGYSTTKLVAEFVAAEEFEHICDDYRLTAGEIPLEPRDQNINVTKFVQRCYTYALGRDADEGGLNDWCAQILAGTITPERVAFSFVFSDEVHSQNLDSSGFITMLYRMMLGREPDGGLGNWIRALDSQTEAEVNWAIASGERTADEARDLARQTIYASFAASEEFNMIVESYGL